MRSLFFFKIIVIQQNNEITTTDSTQFVSLPRIFDTRDYVTVSMQIYGSVIGAMEETQHTTSIAGQNTR